MTLPPIPPRMAKLDRDPRGYPIPWNVLRDRDGSAHFIVNDSRKHLTAILGELCPLCGEALQGLLWFVGGPRSAFDPHGCYQDLPGHHECIQFALQVCPWLAAPNYNLRTDEQKMAKLPSTIYLDPTQTADRPALFVVVASRKMKAQGNPFMPYVRPVRPLAAIEYWQHGRQLDAATGEALVRQIMGPGWRPK